MTIYSDTQNGVFKPTFLYIKQHQVTGLKYFGKTTREDPIKYMGSGTYWRRHLEKHGRLIDTIWYKLFTDKEELKLFALKFSIDNNIVESSEWANLKLEDGFRGGGAKGIKIKPHTPEHKNKIRIGVNKSNQEKGTCKKEKIKEQNHKRKPRSKWSKESKINHSAWQIGIQKRRMCCIYCKKEGAIANIKQWHGDNCKLNPVKKYK